MIRESTIEKTVCQWAKDHDISTLKLSGPNQKGMADRLFMRNGIAAFCELKATGKKPTPLQFKFLTERWDDGFSVGWFDNVPEAIQWLKQTFGI